MIHDTDENGFDTGLSDAWDILSPIGRSRHDAMLAVLQAAVVREGLRRRRRRSMVRAAGATALLVALGFGLLHVQSASDTPKRLTRDDTPRGNGSPSKWLVTIVEIDPGALGRHIVDPNADPAEYIVDDRELVATLAAIGRPAGLIRSGGSIQLTAAVTDAELTPDTGPSVAPTISRSPSPPAQGDRQPS